MGDNSRSGNDLFVFGAFTLDPQQRLLFRGTELVALEPKVFETLLVLVESAGRARTKEELLSQVWPDAFVEEGSLTRNISTLRKVLASEDSPQGYIETLSRRGYRFQPVVKRVSAEAPIPTTGRGDDAPETLATQPAIAAAAIEPPATAPRVRWLALAAVAAAALLVVAAVSGLGRGSDEPGPIKSIAVLPLQNLSGDPAQEFFSDVMTEALISRLAQVSTLNVRSRTSVMRFKGTSAALPDIGRELDVDAVIEGSVQRSGDHVRVTVQLVRAATDHHLWAREFDGAMSDVLELQRRVAVGIAGSISSAIGPAGASLDEEPPVAEAAYDSYLLGRYLSLRTDVESQQRALTELRHAVAMAPRFAEAHAFLALALVQMGARGFTGATEEAMETARRAIALDEDLPEAHAALAAAAFDAWDWETSLREYERALALFPYSEDACANYGAVLSAFGRHEEAIAWAGRFATRNPGTAGPHVGYAMVLFHARRYAEAERHLKLAIELEPRGFSAPLILGQIYLVTGRAEQAVALYSAPAFANSAVLASAYAAAGRRDDAQAILTVKEQNPAPDDLLSLAMIRFYLGDDDRGFGWLERAVAARLAYVRWLNVHPSLDPWRDDPRFVALVRQLRLPA